MSSVSDCEAKYNPCPSGDAIDIEEYDRDPVARIMAECISDEWMKRYIHGTENGLRCLAVRKSFSNLPAWWSAIPAPVITESLGYLLEPEDFDEPQVLELAAPHTPLPELIDMAIAQLREMDMETGPPKTPSAQEIADFYVRYMNTQAETQQQPGGAAPGASSPKAGALEQLYAILEECKASGKALPLYNAKLFGRITDDGEWKDFIAACKLANKRSTNGLGIDIPLLTKKRRNRITENRNAAEVNRGPVIEIPVRNTIVEPVPPRLPLEGLHDVGNAHRMFAYYGHDMRWCAAMKKWLVWDGKRWAPDEMERPRKLALNTMAEFLKQAVLAVNIAAQQFAIASLNFKRIKDMLEVMKALVPVHPAQLDTDPLLLNCRNGTVQLGTGERRPHRREDYITKVVHHDYMPDAECPLFLAFLMSSLGGGPKASEDDKQRAALMVAWLRKAFGYSLTGLTGEKVLFILFGGTNCGKSTLLTTFMRVIEEYSQLLQIDTLMTKEQGNNQQADLADLNGARFVVTSETEEGSKLSEARIKRLVQGVVGAKIKSARKYENPISFPETFKLWIDGNHLPQVRGSDAAIWGRLCPVPFMSVPERIDKELPAKLQGEAAGILAWAIAGAIEWRKDGLGRPDEVRAARAAWRSDSEVLKPFFDECCQRKHSSHVLCSDLWSTYEEWCRSRQQDDKNFQKLTRDQFTQRLEDVGFKRVMWRFEKEYPERGWEGIALL